MRHSHNFVDLTGRRFNMLTVLRGSHFRKNVTAGGSYYWICQCDCGTEKAISVSALRGGQKSCGCKTSEFLSKHRTSHGLTRSREYYSWQAMKSRCYKQSDIAYARYGGAGITVCAEWRDSFEAFFADMGARPRGATLDRIDGKCGYEPGNTRWATPAQQVRNRRNALMVMTAAGEQYLADYAKPLGITYNAAFKRLARGTLPGATRITNLAAFRGTKERLQ